MQETRKQEETAEEVRVSYEYPEGFKKAAQCLDFIPREQREAFLMSMFGELMLG